jgi:hypothetical protein
VAARSGTTLTPAMLQGLSASPFVAGAALRPLGRGDPRARATVARLERFLGRAIEIRRPEIYRENPFATLYDLSSSRERLGFTAEHAPG